MLGGKLRAKEKCCRIISISDFTSVDGQSEGVSRRKERRTGDRMLDRGEAEPPWRETVKEQNKEENEAGATGSQGGQTEGRLSPQSAWAARGSKGQYRPPVTLQPQVDNTFSE